MIVQMLTGTDGQNLEQVLSVITAAGHGHRVIEGTERNVIGVLGGAPSQDLVDRVQGLPGVEMVSVVAPSSPLAELSSPVPVEMLEQVTQLVLTDRSALTEGRTLGGPRRSDLAPRRSRSQARVPDRRPGLGTYATSRCRRRFGSRPAGADQSRGSADHDHDDARDLSLGYDAGTCSPLADQRASGRGMTERQNDRR